MNEKSGRVSEKLGHFSKTDIRFWQGRIFRESYRKNGRLCQTTNWSARIQHEGRRERFPLYTPNKAAAASRARDIYLFLVANGWDAAFERYRKHKGSAQEQSGHRRITVGEFLNEASRTASNQQTIEGYAKKFRQIVSEIFNLSEGKEKHDSWQGGTGRWLTKVHSVKLEEVTPARVEEWKRSFLAKAGNDPVALRKARISVNSMLRQARSLFSPKRLRHLQLSLQSPLPFEGVQLEARQSMKYGSEIDLVKLIKTAKAKFRDSSPEAYKVFLLAVGAGLRKKEIDLLEWSSFRWDEKVIRIEPTRYFHPKSEDSIADLPIDHWNCHPPVCP